LSESPSRTAEDDALVESRPRKNRAAAALGRTYPGGLEPFVAAMNAKAASLDMKESASSTPPALAAERLQRARPREAGARRMNTR